MKFDNTKAGDTVLGNKRCYYPGMHWDGSNYLVRLKVERVTPKQIVVDGERYWKDDGRIVGESSRCIEKPGEAEDETEQCRKDCELGRTAMGAASAMEKIGQAARRTGYRTKNLSEIKKKADELLALIQGATEGETNRD